MNKQLKKITKKEIQINIFEVKRPELDARKVNNCYIIKYNNYE
jgi:small subunit ribosomal protein S3